MTISRRVAIPLAFVTWCVAIPLGHGVVPWAISRLTPRWGWRLGNPGVWNLSGVILVVLAAALLIWVFALGASLTPPKVKVGLTPAFLMMRGPYKFTRNPMYLAEVALWMGWAILFGSIGVLLAAVVLWAVVNYVIVPREERTLERVFGESYVNYKSSAPRWVFPQGGRSLTAPGH